MKYEEMSDFEINKLTAEKLGFIVNDTSKDNGVGDITVQSKAVGGSQFIPMNYCNNPSDAWLLMTYNEISLITLGDEWEAHHLNDYGDEQNNTVQCKPGRAVSICFLKMKDAECKS